VDYARFEQRGGVLQTGGENEARPARVTSTRTKAGLIRTPVQLFNANGAVIALAAKPT